MHAFVQWCSALAISVSSCRSSPTCFVVRRRVIFSDGAHWMSDCTNPSCEQHYARTPLLRPLVFPSSGVPSHFLGKSFGEVFGCDADSEEDVCLCDCGRAIVHHFTELSSEGDNFDESFQAWLPTNGKPAGCDTCHHAFCCCRLTLLVIITAHYARA